MSSALATACTAPNAKTAAAARKQAPVVADNLLAVLDGKEPRAVYDGYGSCPLTVERGKIVLAEFGYGGMLLPSFPQLADRRHAAVAPVLAAQVEGAALDLLERHAQGPRMAGGHAAANRAHGQILRRRPQGRMLDTAQYVLGAASGGLVGFSLGLVGGGGSILAVPLMVYLVGVASPHVAIGTSALAVAANARDRARQPCPRAAPSNGAAAAMYAVAGIVGALAGSTAGKAFDGQKLLFLFALVMLVVGVLMLAGRKAHRQSRRAVQPRRTRPRCSATASAPGCFPASSGSAAAS